MRIERLLVVGALVGSALGACAKPGTVAPPRGAHDVITAAELERSRDISLYEAVRRLRPHFLQSRAVSAYGKAPSWPLMLYVNGEKMESLDYLRQLSPGEVLEVRFYEPQIANTKFARYNNSGGAISVALKLELAVDP